MKKSLLLFMLFLKITMLMASGDKGTSDVVPFDQEFLVNCSNSIAHVDASLNAPANAMDIESNQTNMEAARTIHKYNESARVQQLWFVGLSSIVRAAAVLQIVNAQYHNSFGAALKATAVVHALYGVSLVAGMTHKWCMSSNVVTDDMFQKESEMSCAKNYALTGIGNVISGAEALLFSFAAPEDPLSDLAIIFGAFQFFAGAVSCVSPGYIMLKETPYLKTCFPKDNSQCQSVDFHEVLQRKLENSRRQQFYSNGASHAGRGAAVIFDLSHAMPSQLYSDMLVGFGACELGLGLYALLCHPITNAYYYLKGEQKKSMSLEEGNRNFNILRALGFITMAPVNIVYTLGVPDAKTPWILGASSLAVVVAVISGWKSVCDYCGFDLSKYQAPRILPSR